MNRWLYISVLLALAVTVCGCGEGRAKSDESELEAPVELDTTIGSLAEVYESGTIPVRGWGIVAGLAGTGSSECPPTLRNVLVKYIQQHISEKSGIDPEEFINSMDTAVVEINGIIPAVASKGERFDLGIRAFSSSQTTSLMGGRLFEAELKAASRLQRFDQYSKTLAIAQGPVFIDKLGGAAVDKLSGYVLGGGVVIADVQISLFLFEPSYMAANAIRNRLNERFGPKTAKAISPGQIQLTIPVRFREQKDKFLTMVRLLYLAEDEQSQRRRIEMLVAKLSRGEDIIVSEVSLNAIGKAALGALAPLLKVDDERIRFHVARCMLDIGDDKALGVLRRIVGDTSSPYRIEAIRAIGVSAKRNDAIPILNDVLGERNFEIRFAAYEQLRRLGDISISQMLVGGDFFVDSVTCGGDKIIFASRTGVGRIVLFGAPIYCKESIFIESPGRDIVINALPGEKFVSVMRKHPKGPGLIGPLKSSFKLADIIRTLGEAIPAGDKPLLRPGLGISYSDAIALLRLICENEGVKAEFKAGPTPAGVILGENKSQQPIIIENSRQ
jgi:flagellar basal body P-ring protein FlgI